MCTHNQCFRAKTEKNIIIFHLKINIFTAVKYCCILHGHVFVMVRTVPECRGGSRIFRQRLVRVLHTSGQTMLKCIMMLLIQICHVVQEL